MKFCLYFNGKWMCFDVPILIAEHWWLPDPPPESGWIDSELVNQQLVHELQSIATLHAVGNRLGGELGTKVHGLVEAQVKQLKLPKDFKVELKTPSSTS